MKTHVYTIGTERELVPQFVHTYFEEIKYMQEQSGEETIFVIIDESENSVAEKNRTYLEANRIDDVKYIYCGKALQKKLFEGIEQELEDKSLINLLDYQGYSYGRVMNKQFLVACMMQADYLHRRDSDVKIEKEAFGYPSDIENKYLGMKVGDFSGISGSDRHSENQIIYLTGSGYSGGSSWKADFGIFLEQDSDLIGEVAGLFHYGDDLLNEYLKEITEGNISVAGKEKFLPKHNHPKPLCGNLAFYEVFKYIPCSTVLSTIGSDNLIRGFLKAMDMPIIYHTTYVYHEFGKERDSKDIDYLLSYWPRMINKLAYYRLIDKLIYQNQKRKNQKILNIEEIDFKNFLNKDFFSYAYVENVVIQCVEEFVHIMERGKNPLFSVMRDRFVQKEYQKQLVDNMYNGFLGGERLIENWKEIIDICEQQKFRKLLDNGV